MIYQLRNSKLCVEISSTGAQLMSLKDDLANQYIWQGNDELWSRRAPSLFPVIGRMKDGKYLHKGKKYKINIHGFLRDMEASVDYYDSSSISFTFKSDENTRRAYPFDFELTVVYEISGDRLVLRYLVKNCSDEKMYFALGFHPGFNIPIGDKYEFEDYYVDFLKEENAKITMKKIELSNGALLTGETSDFKETRIMLNRSMFENDAIILANAPKSVTISSSKIYKKVVMDFPDMDYVALWTLPDDRAKFLCVEPWTSLVGEDKDVIELKDVKGIFGLSVGEFYKNEIAIQVVDK